MAEMYRKAEHTNGGSALLSILQGVIRSFVFSAALVLLLTAVVFFTSISIDHDNLHYMMIAIMIVSCFFSALSAGYRLRSKGFVVGLCIGALYALAAFGIGAAITAGTPAVALIASKSIVGMLAGALGGIIGVNV